MSIKTADSARHPSCQYRGSSGVEDRRIPLGFTSVHCMEDARICHIYNDESERLQVMSKYLNAGLKDHDKLLHLMDVVSAHPDMIVRGHLVRNPYYVEPEIFLREYQTRRSGEMP
jgi:hypothetical protein